MTFFDKLKPYFMIKGILLAAVYLSLSVFFVFFVPKKVPDKSELIQYSVPEKDLSLAYNKSANTSYFTGQYQGVEMKSVTLTLESGLELYGTNQFFIQVKEPPENYHLLIGKDTTLFGKRYSIYQIKADKKTLISYDFSADIKQKEKNKFFFFGLAFLGFLGFIMVRTLIVQKRAREES